MSTVRIEVGDGKFTLVENYEVTIEQCEEQDAETRVYFLQCQSTKLIKIGIATDVSRRIADIQSMCPTKLKLLTSIRGGLHIEVDLHRRFAVARRHGEWFSPVPELLWFIGEKVDKKSQEEAELKSYNGPLRDLMKATGLNERQCQRAIDAGELPGYKIDGSYVVPEFDLIAWCHGRWKPRV